MVQVKRAIISEYWSKKLSSELPKISLPFPPYRKVENTLEPMAQSVQSEIPPPLAEKLFKISRNSDIALFILVLSGINIVLSRYAGSDDVLVGTLPRAADEDDSSIIFCRTQICDRTAIKEFVTQTKAEVLEAIKFKGFSPDDMVEILKVKSNTDAQDIFYAAFLYEPFQRRSKLLDRFGLVFLLTKQKNRLVLHLEAPHFCSSAILTNLSRNVIAALDRMLANMSRQISMLDILNLEEKNQLLYDFNKTKTEYPPDKTTHRLFEEQVVKMPNQIAVVGPTPVTEHGEVLMKKVASSSHLVQISYFELNEKANRLASSIREQGVQPDIIVGIMIDRSLEMSIGILGILKSGGAYLPIDPGYPVERIEFI
jgi:non-ribosomal peptide synthetase component F